MIKKTIILHPFLFGLFPVLFLYSHNIGQLRIREIFLPSAIILVFTAIIAVLFWIILKKDLIKAGLITAAFIIMFFSYGRVYDLISGWRLGEVVIGRHRYLMIFWVILFALIMWLIVKTKKDLKNINSILNIIAIVLILIPLINIGVYKIRSRNIDEYVIAESNAEEKNIKTINNGSTHDIYYIIFDGYASSSTLHDYYNYDNSDFEKYLTEKGFFIANESTSNYPTTFLSLPSSLNMEYINYLTDILGVEYRDNSITYQMIENNKVVNFLKSRGYEYIHFSSGWGPTNNNENADRSIAISYSRWNEFQSMLIKTTALDAFEKKFFADIDRRRVLNTFYYLSEIGKTGGNKFIFAHIICPHPPYLFDRDGNSVPEASFDMNEWGQEQKEYYLNQLIFTNKKIKDLVDIILSESKSEPIIVLQADHGPHNTFIEGEYPTDDMFREGMRIFNAYYFPSNDYSELYESITPVNTFRVIFNTYFNTDYEILADRNYYSFEIEPYRFIDITDILSYD